MAVQKTDLGVTQYYRVRDSILSPLAIPRGPSCIVSMGELLDRHDLELVIHEDSQATILVAKKGYSPKLRHISRTHKVNLGCISEQLSEGSHISIQYVDTAEQAADIFTKALPPQNWDNALKLLGLRQSLPPVLQDQRQLPTKLLPKAESAATGALAISRHTAHRTDV